MLTDLRPLLLDLTGLDEAAIEALGVKTYCDYYLQRFNRGIHNAHDGEPVYFYRSTAMSHALHQTIDGPHGPTKGPICPMRVARVKWIKEFISGNVADSELWLVPDKRGFDKRCYCSTKHGYVIWLSPREDGGWMFKTAYHASPKYIRDKVYVEGAEFVCRFTLPTASEQLSAQSAFASSQKDS